MSADAPSPTPDPDRRKRALALGGGAILLAAIVVAVLIVTSQSGSDDTASDGDEDFATLLEELPQEGTVIGDPDAPVKVVEYGDLQCPACAAFSRDTVPELISGPVADGSASLEFSNFLIIGPESLPAAEAALAAGQQNRLWQFVEEFYAQQGPENSGYITDEFLRGIADDAGVPDLEQWESDRTDPALREEIEAGQREAQRLRLSSTPSVTVQDGNDAEPRVLESNSFNEIELAIAESG